MSFTIDMYNLLIRYAKDYQGKTVTMIELQNRPWWKCVWASWRAKAFYKMDDYYERLEDVPEGLQEFTIMTDKLNTKYYLDNGKQVTQVIDLATCKKFYG